MVASRFRSANGLWGDGTFLYIADTGNGRVRRMSLTTNDVITLVGQSSGTPRLHRLTYVSVIAGVIHYLWLVKADTQRPLTYRGVLLTALLGYRLLKLPRQANAQN